MCDITVLVTHVVTAKKKKKKAAINEREDLLLKEV